MSPSRRRSQRPSESRNWLLLAGVGVAGLVIGYLVGAAGREQPAPAPAAESVVERPLPPPDPAASLEYPPASPLPQPPAAESAPQPAPAPTPTLELPPPDLGPMPSGEGVRIAVVIDDLGRRVQDVVELSDLGVPLSFSVLPFESRTSEVVEELERRGAEVMLHLPMQPRNGANPGPGALTLDMTAAELEAATRWALEAVAGATGVNNHMGSGLSSDEETMRTILGVLAERRLFYLDSRTSADSVGYRMALELGLPAAERHVFLDAEARPDAIRVQFRRLLDVARRRGSAVAIGHPHRDTIEVLGEEIPQARAAGFTFVPVSSLIRGVSVAAAQ